MSKCELIELKDLSVNDPIDLAVPAAPSPSPTVNPGPPGHSRTVRPAGHNVSVKAALCHTGEAAAGHNFQPYSHTHLTWCDVCGEFIWGLYKQSLRCSNCRYTCHHRCRPFIQLDCSTDGRLLTDQAHVSFDSIETDTNVDEDQGEDKHKLTISEIQQKVQEYNTLTNSNLWMVLNKDGSYTGFIKVHFQLLRPISLPPPQRPCSAQKNDLQCDRTARRMSFYLPKDTAKHLHISSLTPARQVIEALLNKFTLVDNPAKFALFERTERQNQVYLRKLADDECPLYLRLCAGPSEKILSLILKENETGDVNWDAFSFPELCNFIRILQREEEEYVQQVKRRYAVARDLMEQAMARVTTPG